MIQTRAPRGFYFCNSLNIQCIYIYIYIYTSMLGNVTNIGEQAIRNDVERRWIVAGGRKCEVIMIDRKMAVTELRKKELISLAADGSVFPGESVLLMRGSSSACNSMIVSHK